MVFPPFDIQLVFNWLIDKNKEKRKALKAFPSQK